MNSRQFIELMQQMPPSWMDKEIHLEVNVPGSAHARVHGIAQSLKLDSELGYITLTNANDE